MFANSPALNGIFIFIIGLLVVFLGMCVIVLFVTLAGKFFNKERKTETEEKPIVVEEVVDEPIAMVDDGDIPENIKVAIIAAITSYYFSATKSKCDFIVKKIKRL